MYQSHFALVFFQPAVSLSDWPQVVSGVLPETVGEYSPFQTGVVPVALVFLSKKRLILEPANTIKVQYGKVNLIRGVLAGNHWNAWTFTSW